MTSYRPQDQMFAKVILASKPTNGAPPIITIHARYPRIIHGEMMTHRVFSRNARSSRAVPVATMLKEIRTIPFVPWHWGKNQKGMQATGECDECIILEGASPFDMTDARHDPISREQAWLWARDQAVKTAEAFSNAGYHKQIVNRLIEPFSWIDTLITSTSWANFFHLRDHADAEPHFHDLAVLVREAIAGAEFQELYPGEWHLPYVTPDERIDRFPSTCKMLSVARCARISYAPFDGDASIAKEIERYEMLVGSDPLHASPAEHQATPDEQDAKALMLAKYGGWTENDAWENPHLAGNLGKGWIQYRKTLPGEYVKD